MELKFGKLGNYAIFTKLHLLKEINLVEEGLVLIHPKL